MMSFLTRGIGVQLKHFYVLQVTGARIKISDRGDFVTGTTDR